MPAMTFTNDHKAILRSLRKSGSLTRKQISVNCGISLTKATTLISELQAEGLLSAESGTSQGGRIPQLVQIRPDLFYTVGIDVGTEYLRVAVFDLGGRMLGSNRWDSNIEVPGSYRFRS